MLRGKLRFRKSDHTYWLVGKRYRYLLPGITEILKVSGLMDERWIPEAARLRGSVIHSMTEALDLGLLDRKDIEGEYKPWVDAYLGFVDEMSPSYDGIEIPVANRALGYATTIDRWGTLMPTGERFILNIKTGVPMRVHDVQLAGEALALEGHTPTRSRYSLVLNKKGQWKLVPHNHPGAFQEFENALYDWREECHDEKIHGRRSLLQPLQKELLSVRSSPRRARSRKKKSRSSETP